MVRRQPLLLSAACLCLVIGPGAEAFQSPGISAGLRSGPGGSRGRLAEPKNNAARIGGAVRGRRCSGPRGPVMGDGFSQEQMANLFARVERVRSEAELGEELPIWVWDPILPRQKVDFELEDYAFRSMVEACDLRKEGSDRARFGMVGINRKKGGGKEAFKLGTEVEITRWHLVELPGREFVNIEIVGQRRIRLVGDVQQGPGGYFLSRVEYLHDDEDPMPTDEKDDEQENMQKSVALEENVEEWKRLLVAGGHERNKDQLRDLLVDLGPMPPADKFRDRALWVGALINPLPALGVCWEIRAKILMAPTSGAALDVVTRGLKASIAHLDGSRRIW